MPLLILALKTLHWIIVLYGVSGWLSPNEGWLIVYLVFVPIMVIHWRFNDNSCILNNIETWLLTGKWRNKHNPEEGGFVHTTLLRVLGWAPSARVMDQVIYGLMAAVWIVGYVRLRGM
jgi:hypothetical protein